MAEKRLFDVPDGAPEGGDEARPTGAARVQRPDRMQMRLEPLHLDGLIAEDHRAREVWAFVEGLDLTPLYAKVKAVEGHVGRPAIDPAILLVLWLYATVEGVGSARAVARLCQDHAAYKWICGGVGVNYHALADFRVEHGAELDRLLTESVAVLMDRGVVKLHRVAQDGMRVRAHAGAASFRRRPRLREYLEQAEAQVHKLKRELRDDPDASNRRQEAARRKAAHQRKERVQKALKELKELEAKKEAAGEDPGKARASTTDPDARVMKMADGGFRPAYNVHLATDTKSQVIVGVEVTQRGTDLGEMPPMLDQIERRHGKRPEEVLVDGGFVKLKDIEAIRPCVVYMPAMQRWRSNEDPYKPTPWDTAVIRAWRRRMASKKGKQIYKERAATAECVNAQARNRGLRQFLVRGLEKVRAVGTLFALAHNMMRTWAYPPRAELGC